MWFYCKWCKDVCHHNHSCMKGKNKMNNEENKIIEEPNLREKITIESEFKQKISFAKQNLLSKRRYVEKMEGEISGIKDEIWCLKNMYKNLTGNELKMEFSEHEI